MAYVRVENYLYEYLSDDQKKIIDVEIDKLVHKLRVEELYEKFEKRIETCNGYELGKIYHDICHSMFQGSFDGERFLNNEINTTGRYIFENRMFSNIELVELIHIVNKVFNKKKEIKSTF